MKTLPRTTRMKIEFCLSVVLLGIVASVEAATNPFYYIFSTGAVNTGNVGGHTGATTLCQTAAAAYDVNVASVLSFVSGSPLLTSWETDRIVVSLATGAIVGNSGTFKSAGSGDLTSVCPDGEQFWTGFTSNFANANNCTSWTVSASGTGRTGACDAASWLGLLSPCTTTLRILCVLTIPTRSPTAKPSTSPSRNPTTTRPTVSPSTSRPTGSPTTSRPSHSPTTSSPTQSPVKKTFTPTTSAPADTSGSGGPTDASAYALPIGVGVGGGVLFLIVISVILITRGRRNKKRESLMMNPGK